MSLSAPFIRRPVATLLLSLGILLLGIVAYSRLPIASLPSVERPTIGVTAELPGASADTIANAVTQPLERQLGVIPGIVEMASHSATGGMQITLQFALEKSIDVAAGEVQAAINAALPELPRELPHPPVYRKFNPAGFAVIALALSSEVLHPGEVYDHADTVVVQKLSEIQGVAEVHISGAERRGVRIAARPRQLANMGISLDQIRQAVVAATQNLPKGSIVIGDQSLAIGANDQLKSAAEYRDIVIALRGGTPVLLGDVAFVTDDVINTKIAGWFGDRRSVLVFVYKQPEANVVQIVDEVKALLPQLGRWLPPSINVEVLYDRTTLIRASVADVQLTVGFAIALVVLIVALFLKRWWATIVPGITIPVVLGATAVVMYLLGYSLDNLSLMALTISIGFIVDDAIIVVENIIRLQEEGDDAVAAAIEGTQQMGFTIISITAALLGALLPILFMPDVVGRYFREFGIVLSTTIIASAILSLTLTPMLCSRLLRPRRMTADRQPPPAGAFPARSRTDTNPGQPDPASGLPLSRERTGDHRAPPSKRPGGRLLSFYLRSLGLAIAHPAIVVLLLLCTLGGSIALYLMLPKGFMPTQDTGILRVRTVAIANVSFAAMERLQRAVVREILQHPAVQGSSSYIGTDNGSTLSNGNIIINLKPIEERKQTIQEVIAELRERLAKVRGVRTFFIPLQDLSLGVQATPARYQYTLTGMDPDKVWEWSEVMRRRMEAMPQITDIITSAEVTGLRAGLTIDRQRAALMGITTVAINNALYDALGQRQITTIYLPFNFSRVVLEIEPALQTDPAAFRHIFIPGINNVQVPLQAITKPWRAHGSMWINHIDQFPSVTLSFDVKAGVAIGEAMEAVRSVQVDARLPDDIKAEFRGEASDAGKSRTKQTMLFLAALFAVYVVLGMLYESYAHPFTILSTLPSTVFGALIALTLMNVEFTLITAIACILLVGIVMKNAIMMVDFALVGERQEGLSPREAIMRAAQLRVRPIVMTTLVATFGTLPLALGTGPGHELRQPLGIASVGGLVVSQLLTLYTTPVIYVLVGGLPAPRRRRNQAQARVPSARA
jgi:multidrug efflux pump